DLALYRAKSEARGTYRFFESEMEEELEARHAIELNLRTALAGGEFELYYQPLVKLETNRVNRFEALVPWHKPQRGMLFPRDFIPVAEDIGMIVPLGEWVLQRACAEAVTWPRDIKVAVNLSAVQFGNRDLVRAIVLALARSGLPANRLELEVTESVLLHDHD